MSDYTIVLVLLVILLILAVCRELTAEQYAERPHPSTDLRDAEHIPDPEVEYVRTIRGEDAKRPRIPTREYR